MDELDKVPDPWEPSRHGPCWEARERSGSTGEAQRWGRHGPPKSLLRQGMRERGDESREWGACSTAGLPSWLMSWYWWPLALGRILSVMPRS